MGGGVEKRRRGSEKILTFALQIIFTNAQSLNVLTIILSNFILCHAGYRAFVMLTVKMTLIGPG